LTDLDHRRERRRALRLQTQKNAGRFQYRSFSLAIRAEKQIENRTDIERYAFETTEVAQPQIRQHLEKLSDDFRVLACLSGNSAAAITRQDARACSDIDTHVIRA